jgi:hypothetical protein
LIATTTSRMNLLEIPFIFSAAIIDPIKPIPPLIPPSQHEQLQV